MASLVRYSVSPLAVPSSTSGPQWSAAWSASLSAPSSESAASLGFAGRSDAYRGGSRGRARRATV